MEIKVYAHDDEELLDKIKHLLGSDEWHTEHNQPLRRQKGKIFYLLLDDNDQLISMVSRYKDQLLDGHTMHPYRKKGYFEYLFKHVCKGCYTGTKHEHVERIYARNGYVYKNNRGRYRYWECKERARSRNEK